MWPYLLQSSRFHRPRIVWQPPLPFYCSNWTEIELCLALADRWLGLQLVLNSVWAALNENMRLLRWPFPESLRESSNLVFLLSSSETNIFTCAQICLGFIRNIIKNMVKGEILYCTLFLIDPCNVSQIKSSSWFIPLLCLEMIQDRWQRREINGGLHDIMLTTIVDPIMQHYEKGHASKIVRLLLIHSINNDILYSRSADV